MPSFQSKEIPLVITAVCILSMLVPYYFNVPLLSSMSSELQTWSVLVFAFALGYGALSLGIIHSRNIVKRREGWQYSVILLVCLLSMIVSGAIPPFLSHPVFGWLYQSLQYRINQAAYALLAPFIASAAYRAYRARNIESILMLVAGFFTIMANAPIGGFIWTGFNSIGSWIYDVPNSAAQRGITIGIAMGSLVLGIRIFIGYEKAHLGEAAGQAGA